MSSRRRISQNFASSKTVRRSISWPRAALPIVHDAELAIWKLARDLNGYIVDEDTNQIFSPDSFHRQRLKRDASVLTQVVVLSDPQEDGTITLTTAGMAHLGLPELAAERVTDSSRIQMGRGLDLVAQTLAERGTLPASLELHLDIRALLEEKLRKRLLENPLPGATGVATVKLLFARDGVFRLDFGLVQPEIEQSRLLHVLFGTGDETKMVDHYGGAVASASAAARKRLLEVIRPRWTGPADGRLEIKAPFESREWMWSRSCAGTAIASRAYSIACPLSSRALRPEAALK
jgi:hypothetical protein